MSEWVFVGGAYALTWVVLLVYTARVQARVRNAERQVHEEAA